MKRLIFILLVILFTGETVYAQIYVTTNTWLHGKFNKATKQYNLVSVDNNQSSSFEFDKEFTYVKHLVSEKSTSYYLIKSQKKNEVDNSWEFDIISDAGYSYFMIIDIANENIRFIYRTTRNTYVTQLGIVSVRMDK